MGFDSFILLHLQINQFDQNIQFEQDSNYTIAVFI